MPIEYDDALHQGVLFPMFWPKFWKSSSANKLAAELERADTYLKAGQLSHAEKVYRDLLQKHPQNPEVINNLARALHHQNRMDEALDLFRQLILIAPDLPIAHWNLSHTLCECGKLEEGFAAYRRYAELSYDFNRNNLSEADRPAHKTRHDSEQRKYLVARGVYPTDTASGALPFHIEPCERLRGSAISPSVSSPEITHKWKSSTPKILVIDNLLTQEALDSLRQFCLSSTVWRSIYSSGYLGAMPEHGVGTPLLAQIADELRMSQPEIFASHPLQHYWGFKYDSQLKGISVHADFTAVNVNFWITPDDANLDPESGGLIVWDVPAPQEWDFAQYNKDTQAARRFLKQADAKPTKIPYRSNRAVIFDSNLFHETDTIAFKEGYLNRRINITLLYGRREATAL